MKIIQSTLGSIPYWVIDTWSAMGIVHGFLGRELDVADSGISETLIKKIFPDATLYLLEQCHGTDVVQLNGDEIPASRVADGWISRGRISKQNAVFGIKTADCFPVLLRAPRTKSMAALHCGWRGATLGLTRIAIERMVALGESPEELEIAIGPGAQSCCYEVGSDFIDRVNARVLEDRQGKIYCNIRAIITEDAINAGAKAENICHTTLCTICSNRFFSYRREKNLSGRQLSFFASNH